MTTSLDLMKELSETSPSKIVMVVMDGLGGLPDPKTGKTELETARTPNLDKLVSQGTCGLSDPVMPGITAGSGAGHLGLFGYDPLVFNMGRGILEALGVDFDMHPGDVATRGNYCSVDEKGLVTDRRAGRIPTAKNAELCALLNGTVIEGVKVIVQAVEGHRFVAVFRGEGLAQEVTDTDPQQVGVPTKPAEALTPGAAKMARVANQFIDIARKKLAGHHPANMLLLRGFSTRPHLPTMKEIYKLNAAAIASYPMYRGLAKLVGMNVLPTGTTINDEFKTLADNFAKFDYFFLHVKGADSAGEDGDFARKVRVIEQVDAAIAGLAKLNPDVIVVTGDHSTPAMLKAHSWHPVPLLIYSQYCRPDKVTDFGESSCVSGGLGRIAAAHIMPLAMANALKLAKFGA